MVMVGVGRRVYCVRTLALSAMFWHVLMFLKTPEPHGEPFRVIEGLSHAWLLWCSSGVGVLVRI